MKKKSIIILTTPCIYDAQKYFAASLALACQTEGYQAQCIELSQNASSIPANTDLLISFNGNGKEYSSPKRPLLSILVDHPLHHGPRLTDASHIHYTVCDRSHHFFLKKNYSSLQSHFLPLPGFQAPENKKVKREKGLTFFGTFSPYNEIEIRWQKYPPFLKDLIYTCTRMVSDRYPLPCHKASAILLEQMHHKAPKEVQELRPLLSLEAEAYARNYLRFQCLKTLDDAGIPVDIYGNGWETCSFKHHNIKAALPFKETLSLMQTYKIVLNISPFFPHGSHERVASAILNGSFSLTNSSSYLKELYFTHPYIHYYNWQDLDQLPDIAHTLLHTRLPNSPPTLPITPNDFLNSLLQIVEKTK